MIVALWFAPVLGRLAYFAHRAAGHEARWSASGDLPVRPGDVVCDDCGRGLWCRAHDPWRSPRAEMPADHWGAAPGERRETLLDALQQVLRLTGGRGRLAVSSPGIPGVSA